MKTVIAWSFLVLSPILLGVFPCLAVVKYLNLGTDVIGAIFGGYAFVWVMMYVSWFDGSKYQNAL